MKIPTSFWKAFKFLVLSGLLSMSAAQSSSAQSGTVVVSAKCAIFAAVTNALPTGGTAGPALKPIHIALTPGQSRVLVVTNVTGNIGAGTTQPEWGPDGGYWFGFGVNLTAWGGISGVFDGSTNNCLPLMGVFTAGTPTNPPPPALDVTTLKSNATFSAVLYQQFFIGDGLTGRGTGTQQQFFVPDGATDLFLGFSDGFSLQGTPGYYGDNPGQLSVTYSVVVEPKLDISIGPGRSVMLRWGTVSGSHYQVQYRSTLGGSTWTNFLGSILGNGSTNSVADIAVGQAGRFYRLLMYP